MTTIKSLILWKFTFKIFQRQKVFQDNKYTAKPFFNEVLNFNFYLISKVSAETIPNRIYI